MRKTIAASTRRTTPLGAKAQRAYDALLNVLERELEHTPWNHVYVTHVAARAGYSAASFYQHFPTLEDAFAALCDRTREQGRALTEHMRLIRALLDHEQAEYAKAGESR